ncbi:hypothetical protein PPYR_08762 [Photinus pyralis]|uniref:Glycolipid transfer protein domain-containing protein n=1 Tax=Photinus pyralis TaxID=7054 RepID=A0A5N4AKD2_PHOPY|nr:ceramide-1-phosphate transfer protein [Photinus pyralis]KAB0797769.1 hypothetical protein PPYR_08762 [Photinus pyralis]
MSNFDISLIHNNFQQSLAEENDVALKEYLDGYEELNKFCNLMGVIFGFVSKDLRSKMDILYDYLKDSNNSQNYTTVKQMIEYEKQTKLLDRKDFTSGSRTLLRLHRGLDFLRVFLKGVSELKDNENTSPVGRAAYDKTLSHHHTFVVRNGARLAMHTMPTREQLLKKLCGENAEEIERTITTLPKMLDVTTVVFDRIDNLYTVHELHTLP